jgi:sugar phosphate isomerase/epimerase
MKLSFSTLGCPHYNIDQIIGIAVENGYQGIEIRAVGGTVDIHTLDEFKGGGLADTAKKIKAAGLEVSCVGTGVRFNKACKDDQTKNLELAKTGIEIAKALDCPYIRVFGGPMIPTQGYTESMKWLWEGNSKLCELAQGTGVLPLIETHDDFSASARVGELLGGLSAGSKIALCWDILHPLRFGEAVEDTYAALKDLIRHVHIKDSTVFNAKGFDFELIGEGKVPIAECIALLKSGGYEGYLSFEWEKLWHPEIPGPEIAIPHYAKNITKFM